MARYKSRQRLTAGQRDGIVFLIAVLLLLLFFRPWKGGDPQWQPLELDEEMMCQIQLLDSLRRVAQQHQSPRVYPFNPTFLNDYRAYVLDLPAEAVDRIAKFRNQGKWINSLKQFQAITGLEDSVMQRIEPFLKLPEFKKPNSSFGDKSLSDNRNPIDLNTAKASELMYIRGIGPVKSKRIVEFRERIGGFAHMHQLYAVYGLDTQLVDAIKEQFFIDQTRTIIKMQVNKASVSDLATIPGISFETARLIWLERRRVGEFTSWSQLRAIPVLQGTKFALIEVYLTLD